MRQLTQEEVLCVDGGIHFHIGAIIASIVIGAVTAGPVGVGYALSTIVMAQGIDNLTDMAVDEFGNKK